MKYIAFDTETGGLTPDKSLLTVYAVILDEQFRTVEEIDLKLRPDTGSFICTEESLKVNGINLLKHQIQAVPYSKAASDFTSFLQRHAPNKKRLTAIGSNIPFDKMFVKQYLCPNLDDYIAYKHLDVGNIFEFLKVSGIVPKHKSGKLGDIAQHFNVKVNNALHDAKEDTLVTVRILKKMIEVVGGR